MYRRIDCYNEHEIRGREQYAKSVEVGCQFKGYAWGEEMSEGEGKREGGIGVYRYRLRDYYSPHRPVGT